ncbi:uncharacterized protein LOC121591025 [Anopheles merus]|uniref:uncharacterized protein LOC121591025 n=1 Tax=Anopheles merus TaxID=30066 RepID=UPI001BE4D201|nr:uncharacterized protein LOC121591025 [Anopheles merus]
MTTNNEVEQNGALIVKSEASEATVIAKINFPDFDQEDIETWFICLEASFHVNGIKLDKFKFNTVIVALGSRAKYVHSVIKQCQNENNSNKYETLKEAVIAHFQPSETQRLSSLLSGMSLGDQKLSVLLSEMRRLGGAGCTDNILTNLWLRVLPNTTRAIIAAMPTATLDDQAKVADKILEAPREQISSIQHRGDAATINSLEQRIEALTQRLDEALTADGMERQPEINEAGSAGFISGTVLKLANRGVLSTATDVSANPQTAHAAAASASNPASATDNDSSNNNRLQRIHIHDPKTSNRFLIDTGADVSVVPPTLRERNSPKHSQQLFAANGTPIHTYGTKRITVDLGLRRSFVWVFVVADVKSPIIGADFLKHYDLLVDLRRCKLIDNTTRFEIENINAVTEPAITTFDMNSPFSDILTE